MIKDKQHNEEYLFVCNWETDSVCHDIWIFAFFCLGVLIIFLVFIYVRYVLLY